MEPRPNAIPSVIAVFGSQRYLQSLVLEHLARKDDFVVSMDGGNSRYVDVADQLDSQSLFGAEDKIVVIRDADDFISANRERLEGLVERHSGSSVPLVLMAQAWPSTTRLYKLIDKTGWQIQCDAPVTKSGKSTIPDTATLGRWLEHRCQTAHLFKIRQDAARLALDLCDGDFGRADQEFARIGLLVDSNEIVDRNRIQELVGGWRSQTMFEAIDAAVEGEAATALLLIDRLLKSGEHPLALFGQIAWSLRRYPAAMRTLDQIGGGRGSMRAACQQAGFRNFRGELDRAEHRMRRLGRQRVEQLPAVLLNIDRSLKGSHSRDDRARLAIEKLILWLV